jgi:hypothetical protein
VTGAFSGGTQVMAPRFWSVPAPVFVTVSVSLDGTAVVPPTDAVNESALRLSASTGWRRSSLTSSDWGELTAFAELIDTATLSGLPVRPDGFAVRVTVLPATEQLSQAAGEAGQVGADRVPPPVFETVTVCWIVAVVPRTRRG